MCMTTELAAAVEALAIQLYTNWVTVQPTPSNHLSWLYLGEPARKRWRKDAYNMLQECSRYSLAELDAEPESDVEGHKVRLVG
jgi:hypothetical protein